MKTFECNTSTLMEVFGVSRQTISNYVDQGMPKLDRDAFDLLAAGKWKLARMEARVAKMSGQSGLELEETRWKKAQADLQELRLAKLRTTLAPIDLAKEEWRRRVKATRRRFLALPPRLAPKIRAAKTAGEIKTMLDVEIRDVLEKLSAID